MSMSDPVSDMLTRIRNAQMCMKSDVLMPASGLKQAIAGILEQEGYISGFALSGEGANKKLAITLKYYQGKPVIDRIQRVSKPGLRCYRKANELPRIMGGLGIAIVSTSQGLMTDRRARSEGIGGEVLCVVA